MIEEAVAGRATINTWTTNSHTLTTVNGLTSEARAAMLNFADGAGLAAAGTVICPTSTKTYIAKNSTSYVITLKTDAGTGIAIPVGSTMLLYCDGTNVVEGLDRVTGAFTVGGTLGVTGAATFSSTVAGAFNGTLGATTPASVAATTLSTTGDISLPDGAKAIFGAGSDLQIFHDAAGGHSRIDDTGTGNLVLRAAGALVVEKYGGDTMANFANDGAVTLYYDNAAKIGTTSTGIDVTGTVTADNAEIGTLGASDANAIIDLTGDTTYTDFGFRIIRNSGANGRTDLRHRGTGDFVIEAVEAAEIAFETSDTERLRLANNGDISFYEDTGTTAKFFWDASAESLGIGTSSPSSATWSNFLQVEATYPGVVYNSTAGGSNYKFSTGVDDDKWLIRDETAAATRLIVNASGNLLVGKTSGTAGNTIETNGRISAGSGSNSQPTFNCENDTNTGINLPESDRIQFITGGAEAMRIDASGNVGIGETSPSTFGKLVVTGSTPFAVLRSSDVTTAGFSMLVNGGSNGVGSIATDDGGHLTFDTGSTGAGQAERMRIDSSGNVGIGVVPTTDHNPVVEALQIGSTANLFGRNDAEVTTLTSNSYLSVAGYPKYITTNEASEYTQVSGNHIWYNAPSGTAGAACTQTERMRIDASGNLGIGTSSPTNFLGGKVTEITNSSNVASIVDNQDLIVKSVNRFSAISVIAKNTAGSQLNFGDSDDREVGGFQYDHTDNYLVTRVNGAEAMRLDASGNLLVGKTAENTTTVGIQARADGLFTAVKASAESAIFGRNTDDGNIVVFRKDGATVGSIGSRIGTGLTIDSNGTTDGLLKNNGAESFGWNANYFYPRTDNTKDLGLNALRFKDLYLSGGVYLGGTGAANHLDDYEEGTWTPVWSPATGAFSSVTYRFQNGVYTKIGNVVYISCQLASDAITVDTGSGNISIGGLPFTAMAVQNSGMAVSNVADFAGDFPNAANIAPNSQTLRLFYRTAVNGATSSLNVTDLSTATLYGNLIDLSGFYYV